MSVPFLKGLQICTVWSSNFLILIVCMRLDVLYALQMPLYIPLAQAVAFLGLFYLQK